MKTLAGKVSCKGDASQSKTCHLPLGVGSLTFNAMSSPIKKGSTSVSVDLSLSALLPGALAHTETKVTATATGGDKLFCMDIKSAPALDDVMPQVETSASKLKLAWNDCGDSSTHTKITSFTPSAITTGQKATMTGVGDLDEDVSGANFDLEMKTLAGKVSCKGDASQSKTCSLPLGVGSLTFNAMAFPIKKGSTSVSVDLSLSALLPGALAHTETKVTATATGGDKLFCMDIKSAPAVNEAPMVMATNASILEGVDCSKAACQKDCGCAMDKCAASIQTCLADKTCAKGQDCVMNCACGDKHCAMKCARAHPSRKGMAVAMCLANNCESDTHARDVIVV